MLICCPGLCGIFANHIQAGKRNCTKHNISIQPYFVVFLLLYRCFLSLVTNFQPQVLNGRIYCLLAFLCQFGGQFLITYGIANISASSGSIGLLMQPLTATILASFIFLEILNTNQILFVLITLFGIYRARISLSKN